jgi:uncharacterized protein YbbC (DUF1343 family)
VKLKILFSFYLFFQLNCGNKAIVSEPSRMPQRVIEDTLVYPVQPGASDIASYLAQLKGSRGVALIVNQTSRLDSVHLVDTLLSLGVNIKRIFAPEHGFRGEADAGEKVQGGVDASTGLPIVSLYGSNKKPAPSYLEDVDWVVFDIQDVGARFYTYISTMHYAMEACAEQGVRFMVLDRPNPNGHYVDGPVLEEAYRSFVGMHPVPVVHGMTVGEYARMINGEGWLKAGIQVDLTVIPSRHYTHSKAYALPVPPSPNLPNMRSIYLYPSLCFFEGTNVSVGRGTNKQFQIYGKPGFEGGQYRFTPVSMPGAKYPKHEGKLCQGYDLSEIAAEEIRQEAQLNLRYLIDFYNQAAQPANFFLDNGFFDKLAGSDQLRLHIVDGKTEAEIRKGWQPALSAFRQKRAKYLLYEDFE